VALRPELHSQKLQLLAYRAEEGKPPQGSNVGFLCNFKRVVDLDAEVAHGGLDLIMAKQKLDRSEISGSPIDEGGFCATLMPSSA
jgi:hypothetical protein